jgi:hypothetical protein
VQGPGVDGHTLFPGGSYVPGVQERTCTAQAQLPIFRRTRQLTPDIPVIRYIEDALAYLSGLMVAAELVPGVKHARDQMLRRIVADAIQKALDDVAGGPEALRKTLQMVANVAALAAAAWPLDDWTVLKARQADAALCLPRKRAWLEDPRVPLRAGRRRGAPLHWESAGAMGLRESGLACTTGV